MATTGERLREERQRLGMNQTDFGVIGGVTRDAQSNYEASRRHPDALYLSAIAAVGADVGYILTGVRSGAMGKGLKGYPEIGAEDVMEVLEGIEEALEEDRLVMPARKKVTLVRLICEIIADDERKGAVKKEKGIKSEALRQMIRLAC